MTNVIKLPGAREIPANTPKTERSFMDTILITPAAVDRWKKPPSQRELRETPKVLALAEQIAKDGGVVPGIITLGKIGPDTFLVDGQHRIHAFRLSKQPEGMADVRVMHFESMAELAEEFITLNSALVRMRNDDIMRAEEMRSPNLAKLRRRCPFLGYDNIRQPDGKTLLSVATGLRIWFGSAGTTPGAGPSSSEAIRLLDDSNVQQLADFLSACFEAWGRDKENFRLWSTANLGILMWLWRRVVLGQYLPAYRGGTRVMQLKPEQFVACLMGLAADPRYSEYLQGRALRERDRPPTYSRIREVFARRLSQYGMFSPRFPQEDWTRA